MTERLSFEVEGVRFCNMHRPSAAGLHKNDTLRADGNVSELPTQGKVVVAGT